MRLSDVLSGVFAVLVGMSARAPAFVQNDRDRGNRQEDAQHVTEQATRYTLTVSPSQEQSAKSDQEIKVNQTGDDQQARSGAADNGKVLFKLTDPDSQTLMNAAAGEWKAAEEANSQPGAFWPWTNGRDGLYWLANAHDRFSGMSLVPADDALRSHLKLPKDQGLLVTALDAHAPAAQAGVSQNDVLLKLGDSPLGKPEDLEAGLKAAGEKPIVLLIYHDGSARKITIQPLIHVSFGPVPAQSAPQEFWIGVSVANVEPALRAQLRIPADKGLLIGEVYKDSPAEKAGVKANDILLSFDGKPLSDQKKLVDLVQANGAKTITVELLHEGKPREDVQVTPERRKSARITDANKQLHAYQWNFARPGVLLNQTNPYQVQLHELSTLKDRLNQQESKDANAALSERLNDLDAEIKKLRRALEELSRASKATANLNEAIEMLKKRSNDKR
jgi:membrane-associated protease RseP (regulator of RpoE activity)